MNLYRQACGHDGQTSNPIAVGDLKPCLTCHQVQEVTWVGGLSDRVPYFDVATGRVTYAPTYSLR